ncbi:MAG TPA: phosphoglycolate phosphatase [Xanthobacteraceae bacterium]|nr:phosphoglycolate phosphatase [Xanthobacteraceae bacterium]
MLTLVFDLDGTLIDTAPDLIDTLNLILGQEGLPIVPFAAARNMIGGGAKGMIERALAAEGRSCSTREVEHLYKAFIAHYAVHIADRSRPFPNLEATLEGLAAAGHQLAVCTNKLEWLSIRLLQTLKLAQRFAAICGQDTFGMQKPDPEIFRRTVRRAGGDPARAIMIGDSKTDIATARAAGAPVIAVDFGYSDVPIGRLGPDRVISSYVDLPAAIEELAERP